MGGLGFSSVSLFVSSAPPGPAPCGSRGQAMPLWSRSAGSPSHWTGRGDAGTQQPVVATGEKKWGVLWNVIQPIKTACSNEGSSASIGHYKEENPIVAMVRVRPRLIMHPWKSDMRPLVAVKLERWLTFASQFWNISRASSTCISS